MQKTPGCDDNLKLCICLFSRTLLLWSFRNSESFTLAKFIFPAKTGLYSTYEGLKRLISSIAGVMLFCLYSTYEGLKPTITIGLRVSGSRLYSTYEGLKRDSAIIADIDSPRLYSTYEGLKL